MAKKPQTPYGVSLNELHDFDSRKEIRQKGSVALYHNGMGAMGVILSMDHAEPLLGPQIWNDVCSTSITNFSQLAHGKLDNPHFWKTVTFNSNTEELVFLSKACAQKHWNDMQLSLPADVICDLAEELDFPVWPHIEIEGKGLKRIQADCSHNIPYIGVRKLACEGGMESFQQEINELDKPVAWGRSRSETKAYFLPLSMRDVLDPTKFTQQPVTINAQRTDTFSLRDKAPELKPDIIYTVFSHRLKYTPPLPLFYMIAPEPDATLQNIIDSAYSFTPYETPSYKEEDMDLFHGPQIKSKFNMPSALQIAYVFNQAVSQKTSKALKLQTMRKEQFIGVIANPSTIEQLQKTPLNPPMLLGQQKLCFQENSTFMKLLRAQGTPSAHNIPSQHICTTISNTPEAFFTQREQDGISSGLKNFFNRVFITEETYAFQVKDLKDQPLALMTLSPKIYKAALEMDRLLP